jgi:DNA-binding NarL/FixJ family response regulator
MTSSDEYPWPYYADLQARCRRVPRISDYAWGLETALNYLLEAISTNTVPSDPDDLVAMLNRAIASASRRNRSQSAAKIKIAAAAGAGPDECAAAEARIEITRVMRLVSSNDLNVLVDAGVGYTDHQIAERRHTTAGAVRVRLSRLRVKLVA